MMSASAKRTLLLTAAAVAWAAALIGAFASFQPSWIVSIVKAPLIGAMVFLAAWGTGDALLSFASGRIARWLATCPGTRAAMGLAVNAWLLLLADAVGLKIDVQTLTLFAVGLAANGALRRPWDRIAWHAPSITASNVLLGLLAIMFAMIASTPVTSYDALEYHLGGPVCWLDQGGFAPIPGNFYTGLPSTMEVNYTLCMAVGGAVDGPIAARWLHMLVAATWLCVVDRLARRLGLRTMTQRTGVALVLLAFPEVFATCIEAHNDALISLNYAIAVLAALALGPRPLGAWIVGTFVGLAFGAKFTALTLALIPIGLLVASRSPEHLVQRSSGYVAGFSIAASPWILRAALTTGFPFFPMTALGWGPLDTGLQWNADLARDYQAVHLAHFPWEVAAYVPQWLNRLGAWGWGWLLGLLVLAATLRRTQASLAIAGVLATCAWAILGGSPVRFLLPIQPFVACGLMLALSRSARWMFDSADQEVGVPRNVVSAGAMLLLLPQALAIALTLATWNIPKAALRLESAWAAQAPFLAGWDKAPFVESIEHYNATHKMPARVFLLYEARLAHLPTPARTITVHDAVPKEWTTLPKLRAAGFTHLIVNELELERLRSFYPPNPSDRPSRAGEPSRRVSATEPRSKPGSLEFYRDWLPVAGPAANIAGAAAPTWLGELPTLRLQATLTTPDLTPAGHRIWMLELR